MTEQDALEMKQTKCNYTKRMLNETTEIINIYLHLTLLFNILILLFVFIVSNTLILRLEVIVNALGRYGFIYLNFFKMY